MRFRLFFFDDFQLSAASVSKDTFDAIQRRTRGNQHRVC
jgi:hypothetical protein